MHETEEQDYVC